MFGRTRKLAPSESAPHRWRLFTFATLFLAMLAGGAIVTAQEEDPAEDEDLESFGLFQTVPRELRRPLNRAKEAIQTQEYAEATAELGKIFDAEDQQDYFIGDRRAPTRTSLRAEAMRLLGSIPVGERKAYELQYGATARKMLDSGLANGRPDELAEVARRYFHTDAGYEAALLLGRHYFSRGEPAAAAAMLARVHEVETVRDRFEPSLSLLLAASYSLSGNSSSAKLVMLDLKQRMPKAKTEIGGKPVPVFEGDEDPLARLVAWIGPSQQTVAAAESWLNHRGAGTRAGVAEDGVPHPVPLWSAPTAETPAELQAAVDRRRELLKSGTSLATSLSPVVVGDWVIARTVDGLFGIDRRSGRRVWKFPPDDVAVENTPTALGRQKGTAAQQTYVRQRIWDDAPYGHISSDGRAVFVVDGLGYAGGPILPNRMGRMPGIFPAFDLMEPHNRLVALDIQREGKQLWSIGGGDAEGTPLADAFFLGPPLPVHGTLYAIADIRGEAALVAIDAATGEFKWKQQLAQRDTAGLRRENSQRLGGCAPSFADGLLVCPTGLGCVTAVDPGTRTLKWAFRYPITGENENARIPFGSITRVLPPLENRWNDNAVILAGKQVVIALVESPNLYVLDRETGKVQWSRARDGDHWVAATDRVVLTGGQMTSGTGQIRAWKLADGAAAWNSPLPLGSRVASGRGIASVQGDAWFQPVSGRELWKISLVNGIVDKAFKVESELGSLAIAGSTIVSQSPESIDCLAVASNIQEEIAARSKLQADSPWVAARKAEIELASDRPEAAWELISKLPISPPAAELRPVLLRTTTALIRKDFKKWRDLVDKTRPLLASRADEHRFLDAYSEGIVQTGSPTEAITALLEYSQALTESGAMFGPELADRGDDWFTQRTRWIAARIDRSYRAATPEQRETIDQEVTRVVTRILSGDLSVESLRAWSRIVAFHSKSGDVRLKMARLMLGGDDYLAVEQALLPIVASATTMVPDAQEKLPEGMYSSEQQLVAWSMLASAYERAGRIGDAAEAYAVLARHGGDFVLPSGDRAAEWGKLALASEKFAKRDTANWLGGGITSETRVGVSKESRLGKMRPPNFAPIVQATSNRLWRHKVAWNEDSIVLLDPLGREVFAAPWGKLSQAAVRPDRNVSQARIFGHTLLVSFGTEIVAFDMLRPNGRDASESALWRSDTYVRTPNAIDKSNVPQNPNAWEAQPRMYATNSSYMIGALSHVTPWGVVHILGDTMFCRELTSGEIAWKRSGFSRGCDLLTGTDRVYVCPPDSNQAKAYSLIDGSELPAIDVPPLRQRFISPVGTVLSWNKKEDAVSIELRSLETQQTLYEYTTEERARGCFVDQREFAMATASGKLAIVSLVDGKSLLEADIEPDDNLVRIHVTKSNDTYLVFATTTTAKPPGGFKYETSNRINEPLSTGRIYAFDVATGKKLWANEGRVSYQAFSANQPSDLPIFVMFRREQKNERAAPWHSSMTVLDKRTGGLVAQLTELRGATGTPPTIEADSKQTAIHVTLSAEETKSLVLKFSGNEVPSAEPIKDDFAFPDAPEGDAGQAGVKGAARNFFKAFFPQAPVPANDEEEEGEEDP